MSRYNATERVGVNAVENLVINELNWIFREQAIADMGIDAHFESVVDGNPTGKLLGVQIKTGKSHFHETNDSLVYYGSLVHLDYWLNHSLPVIIVAHLPESGETFWAQVSKDNVELTAKAWKIEIPKKQLLGVPSLNILEAVLEGSTEEIRRRTLFLHAENMRFIRSGGKLIIYKEEWHNKSLGRGALNLIKVNPDGSEETINAENYWYVGYDVKSLIEAVYPWAEVTIDEEFYDNNFEKSFYEVYTDEYKGMYVIYPYATRMGEISLYRLQLKLNSLGKSFLEVIAYLEEQ